MTRISAKGMYDNFARSGKDTRSSHYCAGCGHGILHKLVAEAMVDLGIQDRTVIVNPIGCAVFAYYYFDAGNIVAAHGRAPCVATALARGLPARPGDSDPVVISYQGDGDLGSIGFNHCVQAASRGERMVTFFVNNATYGMTGGQMAPTSLLGMRTQTSPEGRNLEADGYPLHVCEVLNSLPAPVYIERVSLADPKRIMRAKKAVRKALEIQRDGKGYAFVEFLSSCPTNLGMNSVDSAAWVGNELEREYPLGLFRDRSAETAGGRPARKKADLDEYFSAICRADVVALGEAPEMTYRFSGFGGQGILSLGAMVAQAGLAAGLKATWYPSYGPEQRGGSASCAVVVSGKRIGSPTVDRPEILVCLNQPSYDRFAREAAPGGVIIHEDLVEVDPSLAGIRHLRFPATRIAADLGMAKAANTAMLGALFGLGGMPGMTREGVLACVSSGLAKKPELVAKNIEVFEAALSYCMREFPGIELKSAIREREAVLA
jgi:2-oxoisovalerate ferredoxin oxidoreductase beta subunit